MKKMYWHFIKGYRDKLYNSINKSELNSQYSEACGFIYGLYVSDAISLTRMKHFIRYFLHLWDHCKDKFDYK